MRPVRVLMVALLVGAPLAALATDPPHEAGLLCSNCHMGHSAPGGSLTHTAGNFNLCQSCHLDVTGPFGFPWTAGDQAVPGTSGRSHRWDATATNLGASVPAGIMGAKLVDGKLQCSTCHDQHAADDLASGRGRQHVSDVLKTIATTGTGTVGTDTPPADATAKTYVVQITTAGNVGVAQFRVSNDKKISWAQENVLTAATVTLLDGVPLTFTDGGVGTSFAAGEEFEFYLSYPYLRVANAAGEMCTTCHVDRDMRWQDVEGGNANGVPGGVKTVSLGTTVFHHPVGQALNANGLDTDRAAPLDADGSDQSGTGDGIKRNNLVLGPGGVVTCLTCHAPHNATSNSLQPD